MRSRTPGRCSLATRSSGVPTNGSIQCGMASNPLYSASSKTGEDDIALVCAYMHRVGHVWPLSEDIGVLARSCPPVLRCFGLAPRHLGWPTPCRRPALPRRFGCATGGAGIDSIPLVH